MASETRQNRIARLIQKELGIIFQRESKEYYQGKIITVTVVRVSSDLGIAKVYVSIYPHKGKDEVLHEIQGNTKYLRYQLGQKIRHQIKKIPEINFYLDDSLDYIDRIDELLNK